MLCPVCGDDTPALEGSCGTCHTPLAVSSVEAAATFPFSGPTISDTQAVTAGSSPAIPSDTMAVTGVAPRATPAAAGDGSPQPGQQFGPRYRVIRLLGMGGMGAVYQAWDAELGVAVALKIIRTGGPGITASPELEKQFKNELLLARQVTHKNVVRIHDLGTINGVKYISMPYIQGDDLAAILRRDGKMPIERALKVARQIAMGLAAAHEAGVVHRDLKPHNVMIGAEDHVQIMDFGISRPAGDASTGEIVGTPEYMAPEQIEGQVVDARADIYAFGLILYELLMGLRPRAETGFDRVAAMRQRIAEGFPRLRSVDPTIPEPVDEIVARCLDRDPEARYKSGAELQAALDRLDADGSLLPIPRRLSRWQMAAASLALAAAVGGTWWLAQPVPQVEHEPVSVLITDFENRTGDAVFDGTLEPTLALAMEQAPFITSYSRDTARRLVTQLKPGAPLDEQMAQLISTREGIKYILSGAIRPNGSRFELLIQATDPADGHAIADLTTTVRDKTEVLPAVVALAADLRTALGDTTPKSAAVAAMETFTTASLEAIQSYTQAQELALAGKPTDALKAFERSVALDPAFGRAYAGMAVIYGNLKRTAEAEEYFQKALQYVDRMTEREKYRTLGSYYFLVARNYEKAIENYETLVRLYPADNSGHANLAFASLLMGNLDKAVEEGRRAIEIYPRNLLQRTNYSMYAMYAGDYKTAIEQANIVLQDNPQFDYPILTIARSSLASGDLEGARAAYRRLRDVGALGASMAGLGEADMAMYLGKYREAIRILEDGIAADEKGGNASDAGPKYVALAEARLGLGNRSAAADAASKAASVNRHESVLFPAARVLIESGRLDEAERIAGQLENMLQRQTLSYARIIDGELSAKRNRMATAVEALREAQKRYDSWFAHYLLGKMYVETAHFPEALQELEWSFNRKGLAADAFIADASTLRYFPAAQYYLARTQEELGAFAAARQNYQEYLALRADADYADPLAADARARAGRLEGK